jgi:CubicO group peptidase (beta-lactamase class C family)
MTTRGRLLGLAAASVVLLAGCSGLASAPGLAPAVALSSAPPDPRPGLSDELLASALDASQPGCSAAVAVHGQVVWSSAVGTADLATGAPLTTATRFDVASLTKQFTATAVLILQREGRLSLGDSIASYVNGLPAWGATVTLDALMHHTSHVPDYWKKLGDWGYGFETPATQADAMRAIKAVSTLSAGEGYEYSNSNYILLAQVIESVTGQPYAQYVTETLFEPLDLAMQIDPVLQAADIAVSYDDANLPTRNAWAFYGAFGTFTTPTQLALWGDQYRESDVVGNDFVVGAVDSGEPGDVTEGRVYAAGININADGSLRHDGRLGGFISTLKISPDRETSVAVACNGYLADRSGVVNGLWKIWVSSEPGGD